MEEVLYEIATDEIRYRAIQNVITLAPEQGFY
jgi:hypothetical protein